MPKALTKKSKTGSAVGKSQPARSGRLSRTRTLGSANATVQSHSLLGLSQRQLDHAVKSITAMTKSEMLQSLIDCGVVTKNGKLANRYRN